MAKQKYKNNNGVEVPSVTTIINKTLGWNKEVLIAWTRKKALEGKDPKKISKEACNTGTLVHKYIETYNKNLTESNDLNKLKEKASLQQIVVAERGLEQYKILEKEKNIKVIEPELAMVNEEYQFGLTPDLIATVQINNSLLDYKTSKAIYSDHIIQLAAYYKSLEEKYNLTNCYIVHINKEFDEENTEEKIIKLIPIDLKYIEICWNIFKDLRNNYEQRPVIENYINELNE